MDITLNTFTVDNFNKNYNLLEWEFAAPLPAEPIDIEIYISESPGDETLDGFDLLTTVTLNDTTYTDTSVANIEDFTRSWYYKFKVINGNDSNDFLILPLQAVTSNDIPKDRPAKHILRLKELSLTRFTQRTLYLIKRRTWGTHCTTCWDETLQRSTDSQCLECAGTGWTDGYFNPVRFKGVITPSPSHNQILQFGLWKVGNIMMTLLNYPKLVPQDIIVDDIGDRWIVVDVRKLEKLGRLIEQQVQLSKLGYEDAVYEFAVVKNEFTGLKL